MARTIGLKVKAEPKPAKAPPKKNMPKPNKEQNNVSDV